MSKCYTCGNEATQKILDRELCNECAQMVTDSAERALKMNSMEDCLTELKRQKKSGVWGWLADRCRSSAFYTGLIVILFFAVIIKICMDWSGW